MKDCRERISVSPNICHGRPCLRGTRIMVSVVLDNLGAGVKRDEIIASYPGLTEANLDAALVCDISGRNVSPSRSVSFFR
jgi:uncharacterized protein (DUF433 family)